jgi:L-rhamnose mutarotase
MLKMRANPKVQEWWVMTDGMQESPNPGSTGSMDQETSWWKPLEEVFYTE